MLADSIWVHIPREDKRGQKSCDNRGLKRSESDGGRVSVAKQKDPLWAVCMLAQLPAQARLSVVMCVQVSGEPRKVQLSSECS